MMRIIKLSLLFLVGLSHSVSMHAHPGVGIVMNSEGTVFYTDLVHVWQIAPDGELTIAVKDVHTHQLYLDGDDNLYGEHVWYNGEARDTWSYYVWCLSSTGELEQIVPPTEEFPINNTLVRDLNGAMFYAEKAGGHELLMKETIDGKLSRYSDHKFEDIRWIHFSEHDGNLYIADLLQLKRVSPNGEVIILSKNLRESGRAFGGVGNHHYVMGTWTDIEKQVYVAVYGAKKVIKINTNGSLATVYESPAFWSPCGGLFAPDGSLWIMEFSNRNKTRVKKIGAGGQETIFSPD